MGRVSEYGSVKVKDLMYVERYSHVMHLVSALEGKLRGDLDALDAFAACFPAGTLSGAPKVRAMQIIEELEPTRRGASVRNFQGASAARIASASSFGETPSILTITATAIFKSGSNASLVLVPGCPPSWEISLWPLSSPISQPNP